MFESKDLEKANMTSTKKADELEAMLAMAEDISLEENTTDDNILTGKSPKHPDETIRNVTDAKYNIYCLHQTNEEYLKNNG